MHYIGNGIQYEIYSSVKHSIHFISLKLVHIEKQHIFSGSPIINSESTITFQLEKDRHLYQHSSLTDFFNWKMKQDSTSKHQNMCTPHIFYYFWTKQVAHSKHSKNENRSKVKEFAIVHLISLHKTACPLNITSQRFLFSYHSKTMHFPESDD